MRALPRAASFDLDSDGATLLERLLKGAGDAVRDSCRGRFSRPVCALAFIYVEEGLPPAVTYLGALTDPGRSALLEEPGEKAMRLLWSPADWDHPDFFAGTPAEMDSGLEQIGDLLEEAGCEDPEGAFLCELAWRLSRADWSAVMETSPDFACWAMEHEDGWTGSVHETFRLTATVRAIEQYEKREWIPASRLDREHLVIETVERMGGTQTQARELLAIMTDLFEPDEIVEWLNDPSEVVGADKDPDRETGWTARDALAQGRAALVIAAARIECGEDI